MASAIDPPSAAWPGPKIDNPAATSHARHNDADDAPSPVVTPSSAVTTPPYWTSSSRTHQRNTSSVSVDSLPAGAITLRDNENMEGDDRNNACWAKSVEIVDYIVVNGSTTNIGAFVVWIIRVETLTVGVTGSIASSRRTGIDADTWPAQGSYMNIRKRYSEFDEFRGRLILSFPNFEATIPPLPPKSVISKFRPRFLEKRRAGLQYFLKSVAA